MKLSVFFLLSTPLLFLNLFAETPNLKALEFTKWTPDFLVPDPVALSFDNQGRAYVTQTQRRKANDLDEEMVLTNHFQHHIVDLNNENKNLN